MLFDEYLSTLDKINVWKKKGKELIICKDTNTRDHKREMIKLLTDHLRITSKKLRTIDAELTGIRVKADDSHTIEEIN